jgi:hypothetical protein
VLPTGTLRICAGFPAASVFAWPVEAGDGKLHGGLLHGPPLIVAVAPLQRTPERLIVTFTVASAVFVKVNV